MAAKPLILVDGSSYLYRAFYALPPLTTSKGEPSGAVYGVLNMLRKLADEYEPEHMAVVFDAPGKTFRDELFEEYKAHRPPMPDDLRSQIEPLKEGVAKFGFPLLVVPGVEADDVIGTLTHQALDKGWEVIISTGDKDMAQLVKPGLTLLNTMSDTRLDVDGVQEKFGVPPARIIDYLALVGDSSDNIPGVPKVGPKTASKWLGEFGSLDDIVQRADEIKGKVGESLRENLDQLELSRELATIRCDVDLVLGPDDLKRKQPDTAELAAFFKRWEFTSWLSNLQSDEPHTQDTATEAECVFDKDTLKGWIKKLEDAELFAFDLETTSLDYMQADIVGLSFAVEAGKGVYVPVAHRYMDAPDQLDRDWVLDQFKPLLESDKHKKVGQNLKYDMSVLARAGVTLRGVAHDTMLESYVLDSTATQHDMDSLSLKYLGHKTIKFADVAGKGAKQLTFDQVGVEEATDYAAEDADITLRLHQMLSPRLAHIPSLARVYHDIEMPLLPVLSRMERNGVRVDAELLRKQSRELQEKANAIEAEAHAVAGETFNLGSPKQIQGILFDKLGLPAKQKTPKGAPSTSESALQELAEEFDLPRLILEHRGVTKLRSTYTEKLPQLINPDSGRVHTSYHQAVAATGRLSSSDPNLQNIPIRTAEGRRIRQAFIAADGHVLMAADYSQVELRIMAHLSGDEGLRAAFAEGRDIHTATAAEVFGKKGNEVTDNERRAAKAINFGLIYGMSSFGLARQLHIGRNEAQGYIDRYFERFSGVQAFMDGIRKQARDDGYVETVYGRRLHLPEINSRNFNRRQYAERTAINAPMQGTAADIIKRAMIRLDRWISQDATDVRMVMQVHDELVFELPEKRVDQMRDTIRDMMVGAADLDVPLEVDIGVGKNWDEAH